LALLLFAFVPVVAQAAGIEVVSTRCREVEVSLDAIHSASRLADCGDEAAPNLLWHLDRIDQLDGNLDARYHRVHAGGGSVVYVMDTGVLASHAEFATPAGSKVIAGYDLTESLPVGNSTCRSDNKAMAPCYSNFNELPGASHGTAVASLVAGTNVGVAPDASIVSVRVMNEMALATTRTYLAGLDAIIHNAWDPATPPFRTAIVNISGWVLEHLASTPDPSPVPYAAIEQRIRDMIDGVDAQGHRDPVNGKRFFFVVAGNNVDNGCGRSGVVDRFPATLGKQLEGLITVGGMTSDNSWWAGACHGGIEILAPSQGIFSASISANDHYRGLRPNLRSGTSFAAPIIAGIAARALSERPQLTPAELEALIVSTPSRIANPEQSYADGKVGFVRDTPPMLTAHAPSQQSRTAALAP
jgi:subtilisin family serine protease